MGSRYPKRRTSTHLWTPERGRRQCHPSAFALHGRNARLGLADRARKALNPARQFLITSELFGNGRSSSPSNTPEPFHESRFQVTIIRDKVEAVHQLLTRDLGSGTWKMHTWEQHDVGATPGFGGDVRKALGSMKAQASRRALECGRLAGGAERRCTIPRTNRVISIHPGDDSSWKDEGIRP